MIDADFDELGDESVYVCIRCELRQVVRQQQWLVVDEFSRTCDEMGACRRKVRKSRYAGRRVRRSVGRLKRGWKSNGAER